MEENKKRRAEKFIAYAEECVRKGHKKRAENNLLKAQHIYPSQKAKDILENLRKKNNIELSVSKGNEQDPRKHPKVFPKEKLESANSKDSEKEARKRPKVFPKERVESTTDSSEYTQDQLDAVRRVKHCKDYYKMLGVSKHASKHDIKKAYKQLALQLHPDKNKAPGAAEAFKRITTAMAVLTDFGKRMQYDFYTEATTFSKRSKNDIYPRDVWENVDVDRMPFNATFGRSETENPDRKRPSEERTVRLTIILVSLPITLIITLLTMRYLLAPAPLYSLTANSQYKTPRHTLKLRVPYYVKDDFSKHQGSLYKLEMEVEDEFLMSLRQLCYQEKSFRASLMRRARYKSCQQEFEEAKKAELSSCDLLRKYQDHLA